MTTSQNLHPLAREVLRAFAPRSYFRSLRLANVLAERNSTQCVRWAFNLVEPCVNALTPHELVTQTLSAIRHAIASPSVSDLSQLDVLSWQSWCSGSFDDASPFAQRAISRLGWASMLLIGDTTSSGVESKFTGIHISANGNGAIREMANQCGMAVDMIYNGAHDGRLMVAASFSREMDAAS